MILIYIFLFLPQGLLANGPKKPQDKYMRLENEIERANQKYIDDTQQQQQVRFSRSFEKITKWK